MTATLRRHRTAVAVLATALVLMVTDGGGCSIDHLLPGKDDMTAVVDGP
jgi:hypothetical protein